MAEAKQAERYENPPAFMRLDIGRRTFGDAGELNLAHFRTHGFTRGSLIVTSSEIATVRLRASNGATSFSFGATAGANAPQTFEPDSPDFDVTVEPAGLVGGDITVTVYLWGV